MAGRGIRAAPALRRLDLVNAHTGERFNGPYRDDNGPIADALQELSHFLRDFRQNATISIDIAVLDFLASVLDAVGASRATVLSAYRTPQTNAMLARTMLGVAERSQHLYGRALDVYLPARLEDAMLAARAMQRGGVGWYPNSRFIHLDSGPVRNWSLGEQGLGRLLLDNKPSPYFPEIEIFSGWRILLAAQRSAGHSDRAAGDTPSAAKSPGVATRAVTSFGGPAIVRLPRAAALQTLQISVPIDSFGTIVIGQRAQLIIGEALPERRFDRFPHLGDQQSRLERVGVAVGGLVERFGGAVPFARLKAGERAALFG